METLKRNLLVPLKDFIYKIRNHLFSDKNIIHHRRFDKVLLEYKKTGHYRSGFDWHSHLNEIRGTVIEVGGPTEKGYLFIDLPEDKPLVSNINPGVGHYDDMTGDLLEYSNLQIDFQADATRLPLGDKSVRCLLFSDLGDPQKEAEDLFDNVMDEAERVLVKRGILIVQGILHAKIKELEDRGYVLLERVTYQSRTVGEEDKFSDSSKINVVFLKDF